MDKLAWSLLSVLSLTAGTAGQFEIENLGIAAKFDAMANGPIVMFEVSEMQQGGRDLNGEGDVLDDVLHFVVEGRLVNTGIATAATDSYGYGDGFVSFIVTESGHGGIDLNDDGDADDDVVHAYVGDTGEIINLGLAASSAHAGDSLIAFTVSEASQGGADLNGDGDTDDAVVHVFDMDAGTAINVGFDALSVSVRAGVVVFRVFESDADLNGDGDLLDWVTHVFDPADGRAISLGVAASPYAGVSDIIVLTVSEAIQGGSDLNGDGDAIDDVLHVYDPDRKRLTNLGLHPTSGSGHGSLFAFAAGEFQNSADLNGDGDTMDQVGHVYDASTGTVVNLGLATVDLRVRHGVVMMRVGEVQQGSTDLNGDGDANDAVAHCYRPGQGLVNLGLATGFLFHRAIGRDLVALGVDESQQSGDLNADGDQGDLVLHLYVPRTGAVWNAGRATTIFPTIDDSSVAFMIPEHFDGGVDLNGDGDVLDDVLHLTSFGGPVINAGVAATVIHTGFSPAVVRVIEFEQGGADLNGDGDSTDFVVHLVTPVDVPCPADVVADGVVDVQDLVAVIASWGDCPGCAADIDQDGVVGVPDLLEVVLAWGPCP